MRTLKKASPENIAIAKAQVMQFNSNSELEVQNNALLPWQIVIELVEAGKVDSAMSLFLFAEYNLEEKCEEIALCTESGGGLEAARSVAKIMLDEAIDRKAKPEWTGPPMSQVDRFYT